MTPLERIVALERELAATRTAAVEMIVSLAQGALRTPEGREELAQTFDEVGRDECNPEAARLARLVAEAIRRG